MSSAVEKVCFPSVLLAMVLLGNWEGLLITVCAETLLTVAALTIAMKGQRIESSSRASQSRRFDTPWLVTEFITIARFAF